MKKVKQSIWYLRKNKCMLLYQIVTDFAWDKTRNIYLGYIMGWVCAVLSCFSHVWLFATLWTVAGQAPLSMGFSRQEYWSGLPRPPPGDLPDPGFEHASLTTPALAGRFFTTSATWEAPTGSEGHPCPFEVRRIQTSSFDKEKTVKDLGKEGKHRWYLPQSLLRWLCDTMIYNEKCMFSLSSSVSLAQVS